MNRVMFVGRLFADPNSFTDKDNNVTVSFRLVVKREKENKNDHIDCVAFDGLAKVCQEYLKKGKLIAIVGMLHNKTNDKRRTEIIIDNLQMMDEKRDEKRSEK